MERRSRELFKCESLKPKPKPTVNRQGSKLRESQTSPYWNVLEFVAAGSPKFHEHRIPWA